MINKTRLTFIILFSVIFCNKKIHAQTYTIEPLDSIILHIQSNTQSNQTQRIQNYNTTKLPQWYHFLPSIGYNAIANGPSINFNLNSFLSIADRKRTQQYQIAEWQRTDNLEQTQKIIQAKALYKQLINSLEQAIIGHQIAETDSITFNIKQRSHHDAKITTEQFLEEKRKYLVRKQDHNQLRQKIIDLANQLSLIQQKELLIRVPFLNL